MAGVCFKGDIKDVCAQLNHERRKFGNITLADFIRIQHEKEIYGKVADQYYAQNTEYGRLHTIIENQLEEV